jgi:hypothetical protein
MIVEWYEPRLQLNTYTDSRLKNAQGRYCLCTRCTKTSLSQDEDQSHICTKHDDFIEHNTSLGISAPVFACPDFNERPEYEDILLLGLQRELYRSTDDELAWVARRITDYLRDGKL